MLAAVAFRELLQGLPAVAREVDSWRALARKIPAAAVRQDALSALACKRGHTDGAALFWTIPRAGSQAPRAGRYALSGGGYSPRAGGYALRGGRHAPRAGGYALSGGGYAPRAGGYALRGGGQALLRLLVAYELMWDFLDSVNERGAGAGQANGRQLHLALIEALDPSLPISDYYRHHVWRDDGGYLRTLVEVCRECCTLLPAYERVRPLVVQEARRAQVLAINHDLDPACRDTTLRAWAARECAGEHEATWFELTGAASASLTVHVLLALAADPACTEIALRQTQRAYFPWISAATTMLDSYVDQLEDAANGDHSYVAHYADPELATQRTCRLLDRSLREARALGDSEHHILIVACMVAMYLSKDSARSPALRARTKVLVGAGGSLTKVLLPILRLWRIAYAQRST